MNQVYSAQELESLGGVVIKVAEVSDHTSADGALLYSDPKWIMPFKEANFFLNVTLMDGEEEKFLIVGVAIQDPTPGKSCRPWFEFTMLFDVGAEMKVFSENIGGNVAIYYTKDVATHCEFTVYAVVKIR